MDDKQISAERAAFEHAAALCRELRKENDRLRITMYTLVFALFFVLTTFLLWVL